MSFIADHIIPDHIAPDSRWFLFLQDFLLVHSTSQSIPVYAELDASRLKEIQFIGYLDATPCYTASVDEANPFEPISIKVFYRQQSCWSRVAGTAWHLLNWDRHTQFCGACGAATTRNGAERVKLCPSCGLKKYPRISPAMIVAVVWESTILLAHNCFFQDGMYSTLAGFMNPGETFEQCVSREIWEEVHIRVKNVRYFGNQPWPFPDSQMIAFTAEYESGKIEVDGVEIAHADWFTADALPHIPPTGSISRELIEWFKEERR